MGEKLAETLRSGKLGVVVRHEALGGLEQRIERASNRLSFSIIIASIVVASALLVSFHAGPHFGAVPLLGLAGFIVAAGLGLRWAIAVLRAGRL
jgi:ubiquinone biosynthesis protein